MFIDRVRVRVRAGDGGAGVVSFQRMRGKPRGRAIGGSGGAGGNVILRADESVATLLVYRRHPHHRAGDGTHGQGDLRAGRRGEDLVLLVPCGTTVRDQHGTLLADLVQDGQEVVVLEGGRGGRGNAALVDPAHRAPTYCEQGEYGEEAWLEFELKLVADAALVGFPNAGKSTLISVVSAARPKIADYPFTTLQPNLGVVSVDDREFVLADIPGLIEGASDGKGLGHEFLRHVERSRVLVLLLDPSALQPVSAEEQLEILIRELTSYSADLARRPRLVVMNKIDLPESREALAAFDVSPFAISAVTGEGIPTLLHAIADEIEHAAHVGEDREGYELHRPIGPGFTVRREEGVWIVDGRDAERAIGFHDLTIPEAADLAAKRLRRLGVDDALRDAGAKSGDDVRIGDLVFEFEDE
ncbi:MAG: GTPase ObgE [Actinobacteria bacterium]|nr:GTPase ObgE [Actinomycetota bacterium]